MRLKIVAAYAYDFAGGIVESLSAGTISEFITKSSLLIVEQ